MSDDWFEERLHRSLRQHADRVPSDRDLAGGAIARAHRIRTRRRAATAVAGMAVIAAAVPIALDVTGGGTDHTEPAQSPEPSVLTAEPTPEPDDSATPAQPIELDFGELPSGDPPRLPYVDVSAGEIVDGQTRIPFDETAIDSLHRVTGGYLVNVYDGDDPGLFLVGSDGGTQKLSDSTGYVAVSADGGRRIAWSENAEDGTSAELVLADGAGRERYRLPLDYSVNVWGFLRGRVLFQPTEERTARLWNPETGEVTDIEGVFGGFGTDGTELAGLITELRGIEEQPCTAVVDMSTERELWRSCDLRVETFSPDGRYITTIDAQTDGPGPPEVRVVELATGRERMVLRADLFHRTSWDADGNLVAEVVKDNREAVVRCDLHGACELATEPQPFDLRELTDPRPYVLGER